MPVFNSFLFKTNFNKGGPGDQQTLQLNLTLQNTSQSASEYHQLIILDDINVNVMTDYIMVRLKENEKL